MRRRFSREQGESMSDNNSNPIVNYYRETVGELRKVSWPSRDEALNMTTIVVVVLVVMALFLWSIDLLGEGLLNLALSLR